MKVVITKTGGNFVLCSEDYYEMPISRPYLNYCSLERRQEHKEFCERLKISHYWQDEYSSGEFQCYDKGHDIGCEHPYAQIILDSGVLNN